MPYAGTILRTLRGLTKARCSLLRSQNWRSDGYVLSCVSNTCIKYVCVRDTFLELALIKREVLLAPEFIFLKNSGRCITLCAFYLLVLLPLLRKQLTPHRGLTSRLLPNTRNRGAGWGGFFFILVTIPKHPETLKEDVFFPGGADPPPRARLSRSHSYFFYALRECGKTL